MRPLPFSQPPAEAIFAIAVVALAVVELIAGRHSLSGLFRPGGAKRLDRGSLVVVILTNGLGVFGCAYLSIKAPFATIETGNTVVRYVVFALGVALMLAGGLLREWAVATLGKFFTLDVRVTNDQAVITRGPYRWIRHPSYTGLLLAYLGLALALGNWLSVVVIIVLPTAGLVWRIHVEEAALIAELGQPYVDYSATRKRLLPGIW